MLKKKFDVDTRKIEDICDLWEPRALRHFCGFRIIQTWSALYMLEFILRLNPDIKRIIDVGTGSGGLTLFFGMHMARRNGKVLSYDINGWYYAKMLTTKETIKELEKGIAYAQKIDPKEEKWYEIAKLLPIEFQKIDAHSESAIKYAKEFIGKERCLIFCDAQPKPKAFNLYAYILKPDDLIMCHDYRTEIIENDIKKEAKKILEFYRQEDFDNLKTHILSMRRKK